MKKILSMALCIAMLLSSFAIVASALTENAGNAPLEYGKARYILGDADGNGEIDARDDLAIKLYNARLGDVDHNCADIVNDGKINAKDLLALKRSFAGAPEDDLSNHAAAKKKGVGYFTIAGVNISEFSIVYDADAKYIENMYYAASTLCKYVEAATGVKLSPETEATKEHAVYFVDVTEIEGLEEKLAIESYEFEVRDGDLYIYGTRRGNMYAVFDILEDYLGFRFYSEEFVFLNAARTIDIAEGTRAYYDTAMEFRHARQCFGRGNAETHYFPRRLNGTQLYGYYDEAYGTLTGPHSINAHSYNEYWQMASGNVEVIFDGTNHSDYQAKYNAGEVKENTKWNPCSTSDIEYEILFRGMLEWLRKIQEGHVLRKDTSLMSFSICDNRNICSCADCRFIVEDGTVGRGENKKERLNAGAVGLNLYLANRACRDIVAYYEGRPGSTKAEGYDESGTFVGYGEPIYDEYPDLRLFTVLYDYTKPNENIFTDERYKDIIPEDNLVMMWCVNPCNNHYIGSGECGDRVNNLGWNATECHESIKAWGEVTKDLGTEMWFWNYPTNYNVYLTESPNIFNLWYDYKYLFEECGITGVYYEASDKYYLTEDLKAHMSAEMTYSFNVDEEGNVSCMSFEEYCEAMKEFLYVIYGDGYEEIYRYIEMSHEAADVQDHCYVNNCDYPGDMFSYAYIRDNYEEMRALIVSAIEKADNARKRQRCEYMLVSCEFLGLSACYKSWFEEGTEEQQAIYAERYDWMYNYIKNSGMSIFHKGIYVMDEIPYTLESSPMISFFSGGCWNEEFGKDWGKLEGSPMWN